MSIEVCERLIVAADFPDETSQEGVGKATLDLCDELHDTGVTIKSNAGLRACGYGLINAIHERGLESFADLKIVDIPATMKTDGTLLATYKPKFVTVMCNAGPEGLAAIKKELPQTHVLGVTVLTSFDDALSFRIFGRSAADGVVGFSEVAEDGGIDGLILSPKEVSIVQTKLPDTYLDFNTPGIRPNWAIVEGDDQKRVMTPAKAIAVGALRVVIGRPILNAHNRRDAVMRTLDEINDAL